MSQFAREDRRGAIDLVSDGDVTFESDRDQNGAGDLVFRTGGVERARINAAGVGTGWPNVLGGSVPHVSDTNPAPSLTPGTEYVWFEMDGEGNLIDIVTGVAA